MSSVERYISVPSVWSVVAAMAAAREVHGVVVLGGFLYAVVEAILECLLVVLDKLASC